MQVGQAGVIHAAHGWDVPLLLKRAVSGVPFHSRVVVSDNPHAAEWAQHVGSPRCVLSATHHPDGVRRRYEALKRVDGPALLVVFGECVAACTNILREGMCNGRHFGLTVLIVLTSHDGALRPDLRHNVDVHFVSQARGDAFISRVQRAYFSDQPMDFVRRRLAAHPQRVTRSRSGVVQWYHLSAATTGHFYESCSPNCNGWLYVAALQSVLLGVRAEELTAAEGEECPVCLDALAHRQAVWRCSQCNHCVHAQCGRSWLAMNATCVLCRAPWSFVRMKNGV